MRKSSASFVVAVLLFTSLAACSKGGSGTAPADAAVPPGSAGDAAVPAVPTPAPASADAATPEPASADATAPEPASADATGGTDPKDPCASGDKAGCIASAQARIALYERLQETIYAVSEVADLPARVTPFAAAERACDFGDWKSCVFLADHHRGGGCAAEPGGQVDAAAPAVAFEKKARPLVEAACPAETDACRHAVELALFGCDGERDLTRARKLFALTLAAPTGACRTAADRGPCTQVVGLCEYFDVLAGSEEGAAPAPAVEPTPAPLRVARVETSSILPPWKGYRFGPEQLLDGDLTTSWQPNSKRSGGVDQWVELHFDAPTPVSGIRIGNGLQRKDALGDLFVLNNRARRVTLSFDDGLSERLDLAADARGLVERRFASHTTRKVRLTIDGIHRGEKWNDLALSELVLLGAARPAAVATSEACRVPLKIYEAACDKGELSACVAWHTWARGAEAERARARTHELASAACLTAKSADGVGVFSACIIAADRAPEADGGGTKLLAHGCREGYGDACRSYGCPSSEDTDDGGEQARSADPAVCRAACDHGDTATCLGLLGINGFGFEKLELGRPEVKALLERLASCTSAEACHKAGRGLVPPPLDGPGMPDLAAYFTAFASFDKGCELGSGPACHEAARILADQQAPEAESALRYQKGCAKDVAAACAAQALPDAPDRAALEEKAAKLFAASCDRGEAEDCELGADLYATLGPAGATEQARLVAKRDALDLAACEAGTIERCRDVNVRVKKAAPACIERGDCEAMCKAAAELIEGTFIGGPSAENLEKVHALVPSLSVEAIEDSCYEVELYDRCACGCC